MVAASNSEDLILSKDKKRLRDVLKMNEQLQKTYLLKEYFREIMQQPNRPTAEKVLDDWLA